jgi:hypothetical protein
LETTETLFSDAIRPATALSPEALVRVKWKVTQAITLRCLWAAWITSTVREADELLVLVALMHRPLNLALQQVEGCVVVCGACALLLGKAALVLSRA